MEKYFNKNVTLENIFSTFILIEDFILILLMDIEVTLFSVIKHQLTCSERANSISAGKCECYEIVQGNCIENDLFNTTTSRTLHFKKVLNLHYKSAIKMKI